jgi:hypothetical protein
LSAATIGIGDAANEVALQFTASKPNLFKNPVECHVVQRACGEPYSISIISARLTETKSAPIMAAAYFPN